MSLSANYYNDTISPVSCIIACYIGIYNKYTLLDWVENT